MPAVEQPRRLGDRPGLVDVDPDLAFRPDAAAQGFEHLLFLALVDARLDVIGAITALDAIARLAVDLGGRAPLHVIEVIDLFAHGAAQHAIERLAAFLAAQIPERRVDAGKGEVAGHRLESPDGIDAEIAVDRLLVPGIAADDERRHVLDRRFDAGRIGGARAFAPADKAIVGGELHQHIGDAAAIDERTRFDMLVGNANRKRFELYDFHDGTSG